MLRSAGIQHIHPAEAGLTGRPARGVRTEEIGRLHPEYHSERGLRVRWPRSVGKCGQVPALIRGRAFLPVSAELPGEVQRGRAADAMGQRALRAAALPEPPETNARCALSRLDLRILYALRMEEAEGCAEITMRLGNNSVQNKSTKMQ